MGKSEHIAGEVVFEGYILSEVKKIDMSDIDGSDFVRYFALINDKEVRYETDGTILHPHISLDEFMVMVINEENEVLTKAQGLTVGTKTIEFSDKEINNILAEFKESYGKE